MVASPGYNISCDPGALGMQTCYTTDPASGAKQEIIGYTAGGDPISKGASSSSWMAWVPTLTTLNQQGTAYQPYGEAGIPYTLGGGSLIKWMMSGGADPQDIAYLEQAPGAFSRKMYDERTCDPLWPTLGCKTPPTDATGLQTALRKRNRNRRNPHGRNFGDGCRVVSRKRQNGIKPPKAANLSSLRS